MSSNDEVPEAEKRRLAALAELKSLEKLQEQIGQKNDLVLQLIEEKFEEDKENGADAEQKRFKELHEQIKKKNELVLQLLGQKLEEEVGNGNPNGNPAA